VEAGEEAEGAWLAGRHTMTWLAIYAGPWNQAVRSLAVGMPRGQCFGLLGRAAHKLWQVAQSEAVRH